MVGGLLTTGGGEWPPPLPCKRGSSERPSPASRLELTDGGSEPPLRIPGIMLPMCGRMVAISLKKLAALEGKGRTIRDLVKNYIDRYNLAPKQMAVTVHMEAGDWVVSERQWGLVPFWYKGDPKKAPSSINAMAESVQEKPSFRSAFKRSRLIIPVSGFYEWPTIDGRKRPMFIHPVEDGHWFFAGLWDTWNAPEGPTETFTVITTIANKIMSRLHEKKRMPVILAAEDLEAWLDPHAAPGALQALLRPCPDEWMDAYEVGAAVGNVKAQGPELILPVA